MHKIKLFGIIKPFLALGGNCVIKDKKLSIDTMKWLKPIEEKKKVIEVAIAGWELEKANGSKAQKSFEKINLMMRERPDLNRQPLP